MHAEINPCVLACRSQGRVSGAEAAKILADERVEGSDLVEQVYEGEA